MFCTCLVLQRSLFSLAGDTIKDQKYIKKQTKVLHEKGQSADRVEIVPELKEKKWSNYEDYARFMGGEMKALQPDTAAIYFKDSSPIAQKPLITDSVPLTDLPDLSQTESLEVVSKPNQFMIQKPLIANTPSTFPAYPSYNTGIVQPNLYRPNIQNPFITNSRPVLSAYPSYNTTFVQPGLYNPVGGNPFSNPGSFPQGY